MSYPLPTGSFASTFSNGQLTDPMIGFLCDNEVDTVAAMAKFNMLATTGGLSGFTQKQALLAILAFFDANAEAVPAPASVYSGTAGSTTRYYGAIVRYPLVPGPGLGTIGATRFVPGAPPEGRTPNQGLGAGQIAPVSAIGGGASGRGFRYSLLGARTTVAATAAALSASPANIVTITAPASSTVCTAAATTPTFDIVACDVSGNVLYYVALGVAAGAAAVDNGANVNLPYKKGVHAEACVGPTSGTALYAPATLDQITSIY
jgi:hypothetical protein